MAGMKKVYGGSPSQSNVLAPRDGPTFVKPTKKPFGRKTLGQKLSAAPAEPSMDQLADREHPMKSRRV